jgi:hypothetical protein
MGITFHVTACAYMIPMSVSSGGRALCLQGLLPAGSELPPARMRRPCLPLVLRGSPPSHAALPSRLPRASLSRRDAPCETHGCCRTIQTCPPLQPSRASPVPPLRLLHSSAGHRRQHARVQLPRGRRCHVSAHISARGAGGWAGYPGVRAAAQGWLASPQLHATFATFAVGTVLLAACRLRAAFAASPTV